MRVRCGRCCGRSLRARGAAGYSVRVALHLLFVYACSGRGTEPGGGPRSGDNHEATSAFTAVKQTERSRVYTFIVCPVAPPRCLGRAS